jgi:hypothetical protein
VARYGFSDPEGDARLWAGATWGHQIVTNPGAPDSTPVEPIAVRVGDWWNPVDDAKAAVDAVVQVVTHPADDVAAVVNVITHPADDVNAIANAASDIVSWCDANIPGFSAAGGLLKDFANTAVGKVVLTALTSAGYVALVPALGAQGASIAFALPGVVKGEPFDQAYWSELTLRVGETAELVGPGIADAAIAQLTPQAMKLLTSGNPSLVTLFNQGKAALSDVASKLGIREDMAQSALDLLNRQNSIGRGAVSIPPLPSPPTVGDALHNLQGAFGAMASKLSTGSTLPPIPGKIFDPKTGKQVLPPPPFDSAVAAVVSQPSVMAYVQGLVPPPVLTGNPTADAMSLASTQAKAATLARSLAQTALAKAATSAGVFLSPPGNQWLARVKSAISILLEPATRATHVIASPLVAAMGIKPPSPVQTLAPAAPVSATQAANALKMQSRSQWIAYYTSMKAADAHAALNPSGTTAGLELCGIAGCHCGGGR